jgi:hypothetical protein
MNMTLSATDVVAYCQMGTTALCTHDKSGTPGCFCLLRQPGDGEL